MPSDNYPQMLPNPPLKRKWAWDISYSCLGGISQHYTNRCQALPPPGPRVARQTAGIVALVPKRSSPGHIETTIRDKPLVVSIGGTENINKQTNAMKTEKHLGSGHTDGLYKGVLSHKETSNKMPSSPVKGLLHIWRPTQHWANPAIHWKWNQHTGPICHIVHCALYCIGEDRLYLFFFYFFWGISHYTSK